MSADLKMRREFIAALRKWRATRLADLAPPESGKVKLGDRSETTNFEWVDITEQQAEILKKEIAGIERTNSNFRKMGS